MNLSNSIRMPGGVWAAGGEKMVALEQAIQPMLDKCRLDRLQGRLKNHEESAACSNPAVREAFIKLGYTNTEKLDEYLKLRKDYSRMFDNNEISDEQKRTLTEEALQNLLSHAPAEAATK